MEQKLIAYFSKFRALSKEEEAAITNGINIRDFKKGTILLREGQKTHDNFFVFKGCVRQYIIKGGEERTTNFFTEEDWILPAIGQFNNPVSNSYLECIEDSILLIANENEGLELMKTNQKFQELAQMVLEQEIMRQQQHFAAFQSSTPEERYLELQSRRPDLFDRVPQFQLASYIGVKPESLSRIRKRIAKKKRNS